MEVLSFLLVQEIILGDFFWRGKPHFNLDTFFTFGFNNINRCWEAQKGKRNLGLNIPLYLT